MRGERSLLVCYDIANEKRLRKWNELQKAMAIVFRKSVFFCRSSHLLKEKLIQRITDVINFREDQFMIIDLGADENILDECVVLGKKL